MTEQQFLPAGEFSSWLRHKRLSLEEKSGVDLPCGECTACCISSYFIHIRPEETRTLSRIPKELLFPAPGLPKGTVLLGYDENGHCPMFVDNRCSIYADRPLTCRSYDCRLFAAVGIDAGDEDKALINQRVRLWEFSFPAKLDRDLHAAVQAAARFFEQHADCFPVGVVPNNPTQLALLALKVHEVFLKFNDETIKTGHAFPDTEIAKAVMGAIGCRISSPDGVSC